MVHMFSKGGKPRSRSGADRRNRLRETVPNGRNTPAEGVQLHPQDSQKEVSHEGHNERNGACERFRGWTGS